MMAGCHHPLIAYSIWFALAASTIVNLTETASSQNFDSNSLVGMRCATVLHGLAGASRQDNFEDAGFKRADVPEYRGRADFWFGWVAKRVGRPRGQLEQGVMSDSAQVGQAISLIAGSAAQTHEARALFDQLRAIVQICADHQSDVRGTDGALHEMKFPQGWPPGPLAESNSDD